MTTINKEYDERVPISELTPHPDNPRRGNLEVLGESIRTNGFYGALIVQKNSGRILAGNHRYLAAKEEGISELPVIWVDVDDTEALRILAVDNRSNDLATYDNESLLGVLQALDDEGALSGSGYTDSDLNELLQSLHPTAPKMLNEPDETPLLPKVSKTNVGDIWELGDHLLLCGDSTQLDTIEKFGDLRVDCVWTDPPYGVSYVGKTKDALEIQNDSLSDEGLEAFLTEAFTSALSICKPGAAWYVAAPSGPLLLVFAKVLDALHIWRQTLVWVKDVFVLGHSDYHYKHEHLFYGWEPNGSHHEPPSRKLDSVWQVPRPKASKDHPTIKPVGLITYALENSTDRGQTVFDPFMGSGSTLIAAYDTQRRAVGIELDPAYCDVICRRFQEHSGITPILRATGEAVNFLAENPSK